MHATETSGRAVGGRHGGRPGRRGGPGGRRRRKGSYRHLDPGGPARFREKVPVNLVFVGYERDQVRKQRFLAGLPSRYQPVNRNRLF
jgi:hypothetical protein